MKEARREKVGQHGERGDKIGREKRGSRGREEREKGPRSKMEDATRKREKTMIGRRKE